MCAEDGCVISFTFKDGSHLKAPLGYIRYRNLL
uniref:Uncharacterized protein n=1 Tax=Arundo donax TaxID=35708 RepID=A0A0A9A5J8_ARUDO